MNKLFFYYRWTLLVCDYKNCAIIAQFPIDIISRLRHDDQPPCQVDSEKTKIILYIKQRHPVIFVQDAFVYLYALDSIIILN